jgi:hypothetical protein
MHLPSVVAIKIRNPEYLLLASTVLTAAGDLIAPNGPASNLAVNLFSNLGPVLLMVAFGGLGPRMSPKG